MTIKSHTCHTLICDDCGEDLRPGDEYIAHFDSIEAARKESAEYYEWTRDGDRDLCDQCTKNAACARDGHQPEKFDNLNVTWCSRCGQALPDDSDAATTTT